MITVKYRIWAVLAYVFTLNNSPLPGSWPTELVALTAFLQLTTLLVERQKTMLKHSSKRPFANTLHTLSAQLDS